MSAENDTTLDSQYEEKLPKYNRSMLTEQMEKIEAILKKSRG